MAKGKRNLLYMQLKESILKDYESKPYYSPLPGERELCDIYNVSRPTVRKALEVLNEEGSIARFPGKGAFFIGNRKPLSEKEEGAPSNIAFYNQVRLRGDYTSSKVLTRKVEQANEEVAEVLGIKEGDRVFHLERLRYINGELWSLSHGYVSYEVCPELLDYDFSKRSLHNTLSAYGHIPANARRRITVSKADSYEAFNLRLSVGDPICVAKTLTYDVQGNPLEYSMSYSDAYNMSVELNMENRTSISKEESYTNML